MTTTLPITPQTEHQAQALEQARTFLEAPPTSLPTRLFRTAGYAGTGKSTLAFALAAHLLQQRKRVAFTAPTHKALNVLRRIAGAKGLDNIDFYTIHSFLGLALVKRGSEKVLEQRHTNYLNTYDVVWLDECSMVSQDLWRFIYDGLYTLTATTKLILMGDPAQLYPVGDETSPTFNPTIPGVTLKQVVRQAESNPLMQFITAARQAVVRSPEHYCPFLPKPQTNVDLSLGAMAATRPDVLRYACHHLDRFEADPDSFRILAWRNKTVDRYNQAIRRHHYGPDASRFMDGERLITRDPVFAPDGKTIIVNTSTECVIQSRYETTYGTYGAWQLVIEDEAGEHKKIYVLHEDDQDRFQQETQRLLDAAKANGYHWKQYYQHLELFAQVRPCYALTIHNAQGSTFGEVAVDGTDLRGRLYPQGGESKLKAMQEFNRLWYVAASRAQTRVWLV